MSSLRKRGSDSASEGSEEPRLKPKPGSSQSRTLAGDARKASGVAVAVGSELLKLVREMLVIPAQIWLAIAEVAGAAVLFAWRRIVLPGLGAVLALARAAYRLGLRHVTPARAVAAVCLVAIVSLAASQWVDYRTISVGTDAYSRDLAAVAPAPEVNRQQAGDAHLWAFVPLAGAALVGLMPTLTGRPRAARLLIAVGVAAIAISVAVDAPKGLDEGNAALTYEGAAAHLLEGFWLQIAAGAVLIAGGLLLPRYLRPAPAASSAETTADRGLGRARRLLTRGADRLERGRTVAREERPVDGEGSVSGAST
jgi:hypothetical protein